MKVLVGVPRPPRPRACCAKYCGHQPVPALGPASGLSPPAHSELGSPEESAWSESRIADFGLGGSRKPTGPLPCLLCESSASRRISAFFPHRFLASCFFCFCFSRFLDLRFLLSLPFFARFFAVFNSVRRLFSSPARSRFLFVGAEPDSLLSRTLSSTRSGASASHVAITSKPSRRGKRPETAGWALLRQIPSR